MKTAFITGATSGIGEACTRAFIGAGWRVVGTGRRAARLQALTDEFGAERFHACAYDVRDEAARDAALGVLPEAFAAIDCLVNNAGLALGGTKAQESDVANWKIMIDTNVVALASLTHKLLPGLIERKGAIVMLSSVAATYPYTGGNVYGGTKAFVRQFALGLRSDLSGTGVRVTSIEPGMVETEFTVVRNGGDQQASDTLYSGVNPLTGGDIAETVLWVATLPAHVNINTLEVMPVNQSFAGFQVAREG
ncbi:SDR family NAD(P)-dependent oxidoreductase [Novosphingobium sp. P6W]|uniref:SDR family NAD(P)-dependent oxidoreductase n=1 Tax=Novosphingobium sp. P6W TaxID=1609758 RepID=UPI0005C2ECCB|nr:SDR family NAD(P)-dependent oxidoreductase [Novosphingobium sp. P6W]AXB77858.1 SDR family NAD(P)-dependent oxidoreductase [Novosphingobium sp. P6W]KIS31131.1 malonic semialdehyde reductase [Novosphingobium sp. P6W]